MAAEDAFSTLEHEGSSAALENSADQPLPLPLAQAARSSVQVHADLKAGVLAHRRRKPVREGEEARSNNVPANQSSESTKGSVQFVEGTKVTGVEDEHDVEDEEEEAEKELPLPKQRKIGESRRRQNAIFESYVQQQARKATINLPAGDDEDQPIKSLVKQSEAQQIISSPREYQLELYERAKQENIIAVLDTGI